MGQYINRKKLSKMSSKCVFGTASIVGLFVCMLIVLEVVDARPSSFNYNRLKRFSEQKILDLEAKLAYSKIKGKPIISQLDSENTGKLERKRRSSIEGYLSTELRRILRYLNSEKAENNFEDPRRVPMKFVRWWKNKGNEKAKEDEEVGKGNQIDYYGFY